MTYTLTVQKRTAKADELRTEGKIPAVVYGPDAEPQSISMDYLTFERLYSDAGESNLIDLTVDGGDSAKVLVAEVQRDPVKGTITHADFRRINMSKEMTATIEINFIGESAAVKELGGTLNKGINTLNIKCLPNDLVGHVDVDISVLNTFDDSIHVSDIQMPTGITTTDNPQTLVAKVSAPLTEEQLKAMEETTEASVDSIEVEEKGKAEEGEAEGGEAAKSEEPKEEAKKE